MVPQDRKKIGRRMFSEKKPVKPPFSPPKKVTCPQRLPQRQRWVEWKPLEP